MVVLNMCRPEKLLGIGLDGKREVCLPPLRVSTE